MNISSSKVKTGSSVYPNQKDNRDYRSTLWIIAGLLILMFGVAMRLWIYFSGLPLRFDEIRLALNVIDRSYLDLLEPLGHQQGGAPLGFLFMSKLVIDLLGESELSLRLLPLITGIAGLGVFGFLCRHYIDTIGNIVAIIVVSLSPILIFFVADFKQYSLDFFMMSLFLLVLFPWLMYSRAHRGWIALTGVGSLCLLFSHPAVFYVGAAGIILLVEIIANKNKSDQKKPFATLTIWLFVLIAVYLFNLRHSAGQTFLQIHFADGYLPTDSLSNAIRWLVLSPLNMTNYFGFPFGMAAQIGISSLAFVGAISLLLKEPRIAVTMVLMIFMTLLAAVLHIYPFLGRLIIFLSPVFLILMAEGVNCLVNKSGSAQIILVIVCVISLLPFSIRGFETFSWTRGRFDMPSVIAYLESHVSKDSLVIIEKHLSYPYNFYKRSALNRFNSTFVEIPNNKNFSVESTMYTLRNILDRETADKALWLVIPNHRVVKRGYEDKPAEIIRIALKELGQIANETEFKNVTVFSLSLIKR